MSESLEYQSRKEEKNEEMVPTLKKKVKNKEMLQYSNKVWGIKGQERRILSGVFLSNSTWLETKQPNHKRF